MPVRPPRQRGAAGQSTPFGARVGLTSGRLAVCREEPEVELGQRGVPMPYRVVVIGAGFGGIGMAIALQQAGIEDFVVVDRADDLGGTWRDNSYPGLTCDVPSHLYSFSFGPGAANVSRRARKSWLTCTRWSPSAALARTSVLAAASRRPSSMNTARSGISPLTMAARCRRGQSSAPLASSAVPPCPNRRPGRVRRPLVASARGARRCRSGR